MLTTKKIILLKEKYLEAKRECFSNSEVVASEPQKLLHVFSKTTDGLLLSILDDIEFPCDCALFAIGGYGRSELFPESDADLLLVHTQTTLFFKEWLSTFHNALWDCGLRPSIAVRTPEECIVLASQDITIQTAQLEARFLYGDLAVKENFVRRTKEDLHPADFFLAKRTEMHSRHARFHHSIYLLEPNCKESPGALRDLQVVLWMAKAAGFGDSWPTVARKGVITHQEAQKLITATKIFQRLRITLHLIAERRDDRLLFTFQTPIAKAYGWKDHAHQRAAERLMQQYFETATTVFQLNAIITQQIAEMLLPVSSEKKITLSPNFYAKNQQLYFIHPETIYQHPNHILETFTLFQEFPFLESISANTLRGLWHGTHYIQKNFRSDPTLQKQFLSLFKNGYRLASILQQMNSIGLLTRYLPAFQQAVGQVQQDLFHIYTVDQHTFMVLKHLEQLSQTPDPQARLLTQECYRILQYPALAWQIRIAALFHDCAKGLAGDHSILGGKIIRQFAREHQLKENEESLLVFLVEHHLLLSLTAQKKDLSNTETIQEFIEKVQTTERLEALFVLTIADVKGTNPKLWNSWRESLFETLYIKARQFLSQEKEQTTTSTIHRALSVTLPNHLDETLWLDWWKRQGPEYSERFEPNEIALHAAHLVNLPLESIPFIQFFAMTEHAMHHVLCYTASENPLDMHMICHALAYAKIDILSAKIYRNPEKNTIYSFIIEDEYQTDVIGARHKAITKTIKKYIHRPEVFENKSLPHLLPSRRSQAFPVSPTIEIIPDTNDGFWVLTVVAGNQLGLLSRLTKVLYEQKITIHHAKIMTLGERVEDTFIISSPWLISKAEAHTLSQALLEALIDSSSSFFKE